MRITDPKLITADTIFYIVNVFYDLSRRNSTYIEKFKAVEDPYNYKHSWWIKCVAQSFYDDRMVTTMKPNFSTLEIVDGHTPLGAIPAITNRSLKDAGVEPNNYNDHQTFDNYQDAIQRICDFYQLAFTDTKEKKDKYRAYERAMGIL